MLTAQTVICTVTGNIKALPIFVNRAVTDLLKHFLFNSNAEVDVMSFKFSYYKFVLKAIGGEVSGVVVREKLRQCAQVEPF